MYNGAVGADQKITVCEYGGSVLEVHRLAHGFLSSYKSQCLVELQFFAACTFLNGYEFHISELAKGQQSLKWK